MIRLMDRAGVQPVTVEFIRTMFTRGAEYIDDVHWTGFYGPVSDGTHFVNYDYVKPPVLKTLWGVNHTALTREPARVPDEYTNQTYHYTLQEIDIRTRGSLPFKTPLGRFTTLQTLPFEEVVPAFRFWVSHNPNGSRPLLTRAGLWTTPRHQEVINTLVFVRN